VNTWLEITPGAAAGALVTPKLPIRSTAAKNLFAIFIKITFFLFVVTSNSLGNARARLHRRLENTSSGENQESYG
jgi:hypothetical protein